MKRIAYLNGKFQGRRACSIVALIWGFRDCVGTHFLSQIFMMVDSMSFTFPTQGWGLLTSCLHTIISFPLPLPVRSRSLPFPKCAHPLTPFTTPSLLILFPLRLSSHPTDTVCPAVTTSLFHFRGEQSCGYRYLGIWFLWSLKSERVESKLLYLRNTNNSRK